MKRLISIALAIASCALMPLSVVAQEFPTRTVTVVVPFPAGGSVDGVARILMQKLNEVPGYSFIVENRAGGAGGMVGANTVAKAGPDGYTLLLSASIHVINPFLFKSVAYDVETDFTPITLLATGPLIISTAPNVPANNLKDFFVLARKELDKFTFGTTGVGSASHLAVEILKRDARLSTLVVAYRGTAPALTDLMSGQIQLLADPMLSSLPLAQDGKIKALAITSLKRMAAAPNIPTVEEAGMKGFEFVSWYGVWGPKGLPADITAKLQREMAKVVQQPDVQQRMSVVGFESVGSTSDYFAKYIKTEMAKYEKIIKDAGIKVQ
jgi:tripartite-type tricarboxylate transporter receptor subunit TctC